MLLMLKICKMHSADQPNGKILPFWINLNYQSRFLHQLMLKLCKSQSAFRLSVSFGEGGGDSWVVSVSDFNAAGPGSNPDRGKEI